jgi:UDP-N-acetyl-D-mannosaminuronate dehydrogenase
VLESTTYPGTSEQFVLPILEKGGLSCPGAPGQENEGVACDFWPTIDARNSTRRILQHR